MKKGEVYHIISGSYSNYDNNIIGLIRSGMVERRGKMMTMFSEGEETKLKE